MDIKPLHRCKALWRPLTRAHLPATILAQPASILAPPAGLALWVRTGFSQPTYWHTNVGISAPWCHAQLPLEADPNCSLWISASYRAGIFAHPNGVRLLSVPAVVFCHIHVPPAILVWMAEMFRPANILAHRRWHLCPWCHAQLPLEADPNCSLWISASYRAGNFAHPNGVRLLSVPAVVFCQIQVPPAILVWMAEMWAAQPVPGCRPKPQPPWGLHVLQNGSVCQPSWISYSTVRLTCSSKKMCSWTYRKFEKKNVLFPLSQPWQP